jgi:hypothetical protein
MTAEVKPEPLDTKMSPARLGRVDWTDELLNWITKYEMVKVALTLVGTATHPRGREYKKAKANLNTR